MRQRIIEYYKDLLDGKRERLPRKSWVPEERGRYNARILLRYVLTQVLELTKEQIDDYPFTKNFFDMYKLLSPLFKIYKGSISNYVKDVYPNIDSSSYPSRGERWKLPWTGMVIEITKDVVENGKDWPDKFWEERGKTQRAQIVDKYLKMEKAILVDNLDDRQLEDLKLTEVKELL